MKILKEDIKNNTFKCVYLLTGTEEYLINQFKHNFIKSFDNDNFNVKIIEAEDLIDIENIYSLIEQLPFFNEKKLIIFENTGLLKGKSDETLVQHLNNTKDFNIVIFIENEINVNNLIYKYIKENGYICSIDTQDLNTLKKWLYLYFTSNNITIVDSDIIYFINKIGTSMFELKHEADKLINYVYDKKAIEKEDIDLITTSNFQNVIFDITNKLNKNNKKEALNVYKNFILNNPSDALKSNTYLFNLLKNNYEQILIVKELVDNKITKTEIAKILHIKEGQTYYIIENSKLNSYLFFRNMYMKLIQLDTKIKKGDISVENAILSILS